MNEASTWCLEIGMCHMNVKLNQTGVPSSSLYKKALQSKVCTGFVKIARWGKGRAWKLQIQLIMGVLKSNSYGLSLTKFE